MLRALSPRRAAAGTKPKTEGAKPPTDAQATGQAEFPSTALPGPGERKLALWVALVSAVAFVVAVPYAREPLAQVWAFFPIYESALAISDLITAVLLAAQFLILRARRLLLLACAYLLTAAMVVAHLLTFPGLFSTTGLLGAGPQSTAWLYVLWHSGFPVVIIAYALWKDDDKRAAAPEGQAARDLMFGALVALAAAVALTLLATWGQALLPPIMQGNSYSPAMIVVVGATWALSFVALIALWMRKPHTMIDLWLMVVMCAWIFDIGLSAVFNAGRFDLGFYAGRVYGLLAATFVLLVLLVGTARLYARLAQLLGAEQQLRRQESNLRQRIFDTSLDLIVICDRGGNILQASPSCRTILGYSPEEVVGQSGTQIVYHEDLDNTRHEMRTARRRGMIRNFDCRYVHKNGHAVPLAWSGVWSEPDGQYFFIGRDMTERTKLEQQLRQAQKMEAIGQLTGGIAHDFNNILAVIIGMTELAAARAKGDPHLASMVQEIDQAAERGVQLVQRMLAFARRQPLEARVLDVTDAVKRAAAMLGRTLGEDITVKVALADELWPARLDASQLEEAILNLAVNARDAMPKGGRIVMETANAHLDQAYAAQNSGVEPGDYVAVIVTDSGTGMPSEIVERVFEPFFTTKEVGKGTGLGLSMVYGFVKQSRGHVKIYSEVGHGTSIKLYFPRVVSGATDEPNPAAEPAAPLPAGSERILVVEDDAAVRGMAVGILEGLGYRVRQAPDGKSALDILRGPDSIDLLFTDMIMSNGVSGKDLAETARSLRPGIKVLMTSGYSEQFIAMRGDDAIAAHLLSKPYRREQLASAVRSALGRG
ncbi:MAG: MASE4 domain-containing protein [Hyphomicrobiaceae bacterium]